VIRACSARFELRSLRSSAAPRRRPTSGACTALWKAANSTSTARCPGEERTYDLASVRVRHARPLSRTTSPVLSTSPCRSITQPNAVAHDLLPHLPPRHRLLNPAATSETPANAPPQKTPPDIPAHHPGFAPHGPLRPRMPPKRTGGIQPGRFARRSTSTPAGKGVAISEPIGTTAVLVRLHEGVFSFMSSKEDGSDLRFVADDHKTVLKHHVEKWDSLFNEAYVWVQVPELKPAAGHEHLALLRQHHRSCDRRSCEGDLR
jgi:hypothetical protein